MALTVGSLFAGIGGFDLGFERAGFVTAWQVEINDYCRKVLEKRFPHAERYADIRECGAHNLKPVDVICGGFPCQDISNAGLRAGIDGERSGLWREMHRIISELRPRYVVVENVAALLGRGISRVLGDLSEIGYDAEWQVISASDVGAQHLRERLWIVAYAAQFAQRESANNRGEYVADPKRVWELQPQGCQQDEWGWASYGGEAVSDSNIHAPIRAAIARGKCSNWEPEPNVGRVAHGVPARVDRLRALGNAVVPQIPELIARRLKEVLCP